MAYETLVSERRGDVALVRLNVPATLNALTPAMLGEIAHAVNAAASDARALVLAGSERAFSSGADLRSGVVAPGADLGEVLETTYNPLVRRIRRSPIPIVTAVRGVAAGAGCSLALAGDLVVAGEGASFILAFRRIGLIPDAGASFFLTRAVGRARAMELMLLGETTPAARALAWGLVNRVVPDAEVEAEALKLAENLAAGPTRAFELMRQAAWAALENGLDAQLDLERDLQREAGRTADFAEGVAAFREKRPASFTGS